MRVKVVLLIAGIIMSSYSFSKSIEIKHQLGMVTLETEPKRIVIIGLGVLDALDSFGIEPIAITKAIQFPDYLQKYKGSQYASSGSLFEPDFETIYMQKPDIIITGIRATPHYDELSKIAPTLVFANDPKLGYWSSTQAQWRNLGKVFNIEDKVEQKINMLDKQFKAIYQYNQTKKIDALTVMSSAGNVTVFGSGSRFSSIYQDFGFTETTDKKVKVSTHGDLVSYEFISQVNPSTLLIIDRDKLHDKNKSNTSENFNNELIKSTKAYKNNRITFLDLNAWYLAIGGVTATEQMILDIKDTIVVH